MQTARHVRRGSPGTADTRNGRGECDRQQQCAKTGAAARRDRSADGDVAAWMKPAPDREQRDKDADRGAQEQRPAAGELEIAAQLELRPTSAPTTPTATTAGSPRRTSGSKRRAGPEPGRRSGRRPERPQTARTTAYAVSAGQLLVPQLDEGSQRDDRDDEQRRCRTATRPPGCGRRRGSAGGRTSPGTPGRATASSAPSWPCGQTETTVSAAPRRHGRHDRRTDAPRQPGADDPRADERGLDDSDARSAAATAPRDGRRRPARRRSGSRPRRPAA